MGEVYRTRDEKLNRDVAIKVLPVAFSEDVNRLRRFEQEAQATGTLNHPNILAVYDVGIHEGAPYVVSELLEGETLRERMGGAALPQRKAIDYALQIAYGLAAAHAKGIVHRDLKPDNLFITHDGRVKILDFGLAKLTGAADANQSQTDVPTRRVDTDPGTVMGTMGYMSPEQLRGRSADHRADIFSFGAILYEMLSGRRAFRGESTADTVSAILREDPPELSTTNKNIAPALERVVNHCLEKNPEERFNSARDLAFAIEALSGTRTDSEQTMTIAAAPASRPLTRERIAWIAATAVLLLGMVALTALYFRRAPEEPAVASRFFIYPPEKTSFSGPFAVSPDGRRMVLRVSSESKTLLWVRALDSLAAQPLAETEGAMWPFWSPDSRFVGFFSGGKLKKIEVTGGPAQTLCDAPDGLGGAWNRDGVIVFAPKSGDALYRVSASGGTPASLTTLDASRKEVSHYLPRFLPDGRHFLYFANSAQRENAGIFVGSLDSTETKSLLNADTHAEYSPPGYLLFLRERTLMAQGFDAGKLELMGEQFPVAEHVDRLPSNFFFSLFSVSETGVLVYRSGTAGNAQLAWFDRGGKQLGTVGPPGPYFNPCLSPDEKRLAVGRWDQQGGPGDIWLIELGRDTPTRFTFDPGHDTSPIWSSDGSRIVFGASRDGPRNLYQKASSSAGNDEALLKSDNQKVATDWSADGRFILYEEYFPKTGADLWVLPVSGGQKPFPFLQTEFREIQGQFSPDGKWIAYVSNESGTWQVYVRSFPASGGKWQVSTAGGGQPRWRRDGRELFYIGPGSRLMTVEVKGGVASFEAGVPKALFELRITDMTFHRNSYVVAADGQRFLVTSRLEEAASTPTTVVLNWTAGLKQ